MISDHASPDGTNAYPSIKTLAAECRMSERQVTRIVHRLEESGAITVDRSSGRKAHVYTVNMSGLETINVDTLSGSNDDKKSGLRRNPTLTNPTPNPDKSRRNPDILTSNPDIAMSPEPIEPIEPSVEPRHSVTAAPYRLFVALCEETGSDEAHATAAYKRQQCGVAEGLLKSGYDEDEVRRCVRYLRSQTWRTNPIDLVTVRSEIGKWRLAGMPDKEPVPHRNGTREPPARTFDVIELPDGTTYNRYR